MTKLPDPFVKWFHGAMAEIRVIWPWCSFIIFTPAEVVIGLGGPIRTAHGVNDNERSTSR